MDIIIIIIAYVFKTKKKNLVSNIMIIFHLYSFNEKNEQKKNPHIKIYRMIIQM